jgi:hypothetical protein
MNKKFVLLTAIVALALVAPVAAQSVGPLNVTDLRGELREQARGDEIHTVLGPSIYVEDVEWDGQNDTAHLTVVSEGSQSLEVIDSVRYEEEGQVNIQSFRVDDGRSTLQVDAWGRGRQVLDVRAGDTLTRIQSASDVNLLVKTYWFVPPLVFLILLIYFVLRAKRKDERERGTSVWDLKKEEYITVVHRSIEVDTSSWAGKLKYYWLRFKERVLDVYYGGTVRSSIMLLLLAFSADWILLNRAAYFWIAGDPLRTRIALMTVPLGIVAARTAGWINSLWRDEWEQFVLVCDEGDLDNDDLREYESVQGFLEDYDGHDEMGYRFLAMDTAVFDRFEKLLDDDLTRKKYGDGGEILLARQIDLDNNRILPDPNILHDTGKIRADEEKIHENSKKIRRVAQAWDMLIGSAELIEDKAMEIAHRNVAEQYDEAMQGDGTVSGMIEGIGEIEQEGDDVDVEDPVDGLLDAMDPRTSKGEVVADGSGGDEDD